MIYLSIYHLTINVLKEMNLGNFQVVFTTGPGAVAEGFVSFMKKPSYMWNAPVGRHVGVANRSVTIVGNKTDENLIVTRVIPSLVHNAIKHDIYKKMNMTHLTEAVGTIYKPQTDVDESCLSRLYHWEMKRQQQQQRQRRETRGVQK
jgi:hypothetical protein